MRIAFILVVVLGIAGCGKTTSNELLSGQQSVQLIEISKSASSRATGYLDSNKIVETDCEVLLVYLDNDIIKNQFVVKLSVFSKSTKETVANFSIGTTYDNHGDPTIIIDNEGYFHLAYGGHGQIKYRRSVKPYDFTRLTDELVISSGDYITYPTLSSDSFGNIYLLVRETNLNNAWFLKLFTKKNLDINFSHSENIYKANFEMWKANNDELYFNNGYVRCYKNLKASEDGVLHLTLQTYEYLPKIYENVNSSGGCAYLVGYLYSNDCGKTWIANNQQLNLPATPQDIEIIAGAPLPKNDNIRYGVSNLAFDSSNNPVLLYHEFQEYESNLLLATRNQNEWKSRMVCTNLFDRKIVPETAFAINHQNNDHYILATTVNKSAYSSSSRWGHESSEVRLFISRAGPHNFLSSTPLKNTDNIPVWLPTIQNYTDNKESPYFMFTKGSKGSNNSEIVSNSVFLGHIK